MKSLAAKISLGLLLSAVAYGEGTEVCLSDRVGLNSHARATFDAELLKILKPIGVTYRPACTEEALRIVLLHQPPTVYSGSLGLAYRHGDRILAGLNVYFQPMVKLLGPQASATIIGRALARVAAHEVGHYIFQQTGHDDRGLMREKFHAAHLASDDSTPFLLAKN